MTGSEFGSDILKSFKLQMRHLKSHICRLLILVDVDARSERSTPDRIYQLYLFVALGACAAACWLALLDGVADVASAYPSVMSSIGSASVAGIPLIFAVWDFKANARRSPLLPSQADAAFLLGRGMSPFAFMLPRIAVQAICAAAVGALFGYLIGYAGQVAHGSAAPDALLPAMTLGIAFSCVHTYACLAGVLLPSLAQPCRKTAEIVTPLALLLLAAYVATASFLEQSPIAAGAVGTEVSAAIPTLAATIPLLAVLAAGLLLLAGLASRANVTIAIEEGFALSALPTWEMALVAPDSYKAAVRAIRRCDRRPVGRIAFGTGTRALLRRSMLSLVRCEDAIPDMLLWGLVIAPTGALFALHAFGPAHPAQAIVWLVMATNLIPRALGIAHIYSADKSFPFVFDRIQTSPSTMLVLDCLPQIALTVALSCISITGVSFLFGIQPSTIACAAAISSLLAVAPAICAGMNPAPWQARRRIDGTVSLFVVLVAAAVSPFLPSATTALGVLLAVIAAVAYAVFRSNRPHY